MGYVLIPTSTQLDKGHCHLWVLNFFSAVCRRKHGSLHYFAFHAPCLFFFLNISLKQIFYLCLRGSPVHADLQRRDLVTTPGLALLSPDSAPNYHQMDAALLETGSLLCILCFTLKSLGSLSGGHQDDSKILYSSFSKDIFQLHLIALTEQILRK